MQLSAILKNGKFRNLCDSVLRDYNIPPNKVVRVVTDSAANMKAAFIDPFGSFVEEPDEEEFLADTVCTADEMEHFEELYSKDKETGNQSAHSSIRVEFGHKKPHISCAAHRLQLVLKDVMEKDAAIFAIKKNVFHLLAKFMKSYNATRDLFLKSGKKLLFPATTRWSSLHITYQRLLLLWKHVNKICKKKNWPEMSDESRTKIAAVCELVEPFRKFTDTLKSDGIPTISFLYPGVNQLIRLLEQSSNEFTNAKQCLVCSIKCRFKDVLNFGHTSDSIFLVSSFMDPAVWRTLHVTDELEWLAKVEMKKCLELTGHIEKNNG